MSSPKASPKTSPKAPSPQASPKAPATGASPASPGQVVGGSPGQPQLFIPDLAVEAETDELSSNDGDSAYGEDLESYTTSLKSSVLNYRYENGRRYHGFKSDSNYILPNDEEENDRLDLFHHIQTLRLGGELHLAPIGPEPGRILDVGTGTGIWAIDMGDKYPTAEILGNDISPIQPSLVPPNVKFEVDDVEDEWVYSTKFDYIHVRYMACTIRDWPKLIRQCFKFVKPGGWVEFNDFDAHFYTSAGGEYNETNSIYKWAEQLRDGVRKLGVEPDPGPQLEGWVRETGFTNIHTRTMPFPVGTWPKDKTLKEIGAFNLVNFMDNAEGISMRLWTLAHGWTPEEIKVMAANVRRDWKNPRLRIQHNFYCVWAQKPGNAAD
ncbi:S-adenosyl-L-methionine-dependent methyltransferase [Periconia macrospinosa]|uniref:S-adenosyl-L-methionine-dependent methyltransferase n=1 Tax=Periconia macrospinosa TaxID=97972 RepID=A0A2V1E133_9PLEO|nr:S-adenosyl-L-methionine-dependent methyltransferase [Periconia macrospinosa]